jgi:hypothetical protein
LFLLNGNVVAKGAGKGFIEFALLVVNASNASLSFQYLGGNFISCLSGRNKFLETTLFDLKSLGVVLESLFVIAKCLIVNAAQVMVDSRVFEMILAECTLG